MNGFVVARTMYSSLEERTGEGREGGRVSREYSFKVNIRTEAEAKSVGWVHCC